MSTPQILMLSYLDRQAGTDIHRGRDPQTLHHLSDVVPVPIVKDGLRFFLDRAGGRSTAQAHRMALCIRCVAQHWVGVDAAQLATLKALCKRLDPGAGGMTEKNRDRLRQFDDPENVNRLVKLPEKLQAEVARSKKPPHAMKPHGLLQRARARDNDGEDLVDSAVPERCSRPARGSAVQLRSLLPWQRPWCRDQVAGRAKPTPVWGQAKRT